MTTRMHQFTLAALLTVGVMGCATDNPPSSATASRPPMVLSQPQVIEGQVVRIDRDAYVIKEQSGRQTRIPLDRNTMKDTVAVGDTVVARFDGAPSNAYATSIRRGTGAPATRLINTSPRLRTVEGIVQQLDGNYLVIRESSGREVGLHVDNTTRLDENIRVGDRVVAMTNEMPSSGAYATNTYRLDGSQIIQGEVVRIDRDGYVVRDVTGRDVRVQADSATVRNEHIRVGDRISAGTGPSSTVHVDSIQRR